MSYSPVIFLTVDVTLFRKNEHGYEIVLIQRLNNPFQGYWALRGGVVDKSEDVETAGKRELYEETDIQLFQVKQIQAYGNPLRDPRRHTLSVAFFDQTDNTADAKAKDDAKNVRCFSINELPVLAFDHAEIIRDAVDKFIDTAKL